MEGRSSASSRRAAEAARGQFNSTLHMLKTFIEVCPQPVWENCYFGFSYPVWYQVFHVAYFIDYWFRDHYDGSEYRCMVFDERLPPEFEREVDAALMVSRKDMLLFVDRLAHKTARFFDDLDDAKLGGDIVESAANYTYADVVFAQIRHVMYNVGYLNGILRSLDLTESDWYAYNEKEE